jgi:hypothetical protein
VAFLPGPSEYEPRYTLSKERVKSAYIKGSERFKDITREDSPGPGSYYQNEYFAKNASPITLKSRLKEMRGQEFPGPGTYDPTLIAVRDAIRSLNMSSSQRPRDFH